MEEDPEAVVREARTLQLFQLDTLSADLATDSTPQSTAAAQPIERHPLLCWVCYKTARGGLKQCSLCQLALYCSKVCQAKHWRAGHKAACARGTSFAPHINASPAPEEQLATIVCGAPGKAPILHGIIDHCRSALAAAQAEELSLHTAKLTREIVRAKFLLAYPGSPAPRAALSVLINMLPLPCFLILQELPDWWLLAFVPPIVST